ncbi:MAG TPA: ABC transporter permease [Acetobacteraceae bacterium]|jgi:peptide/nickel transport system permease protein|nr:ABC transporter permease [Acetobacteraceae bacterium]
MSGTVASARRLRLPITGAIGATVLIFWLVVAVVAPWIAPYSAGHVASPDVLGPITRAFPFGTDYLGRDMLSRVLLGARITVGVSLVATLLACLAGVTLALAAAARGGWLDAVLSRVLDAVISLPSLLFGLVVVASLGASMGVLIATAAVIYTPGAYRTARALAVNINALDFVTVARARGEGTFFIMREEILPNLLLPVLTDFGLRFVYVVLLLSGLSFLGLGIQPPYADWGSLVRENLEGLVDGSPAVIMPAVAIATLTIAVNLLIDNLPTRREVGDGR